MHKFVNRDKIIRLISGVSISKSNKDIAVVDVARLSGNVVEASKRVRSPGEVTAPLMLTHNHVVELG